MVKAEERVNNFINEIKDVIGEDKTNIIKESYELIKSNVCEDLYMDIVSVGVTFALGGGEVTMDNIIREVNEALGIKENNPELVSLRSLNDKDAIGIDEVRKNAIGQIVERLKTSRDLKNAIFLDILNGENISLVAKKYRLTQEQIRNIYEERLGFIESIMVVDHNILIKDIESREPIKSNIKIVTDSKK
ncbi:MAG: hypothetical protein IJ097_04160 [Bacilli bacterium]|nr:hypothetical protein [Bacilli bacterium]